MDRLSTSPLALEPSPDDPSDHRCAIGFRRGTSRVVSALAALGLAFAFGLLGLLAPVAAHAEAGDRITDYRVEYRLQPDGTLKGRETIDYAFGSGDRHGIFAWYTVRRNVDGGKYRLYDMTVDNVSSPTGASAEWTARDVGGALKLQIGDPDRTVPAGTQRYVIDYTVGGTVNRIAGENGAPDTQELYLNPVAADWEAPIERAEVTVTTPAASTRRACYKGEQGASGEATQQGCNIEAVGDTVTFSARQLGEGTGLTTVVEMPAGTVTNDAPVLIEGDAAGGPAIDEVMPQWASTGIGVGSVGVGVLAAGGAAVGMSRAYRTRGRDQQYAGLTPGVLPGDESGATVVPAKDAPVAVRFEPPEDTRPGLIGVLQDESADVVDVTATLVDLAVRGFIVIEEVGPDSSGERRRSSKGEKQDWRILRANRMAPDDELLPYEKKLYENLIGTSDSVLLSKRKAILGKVVPGIQNDMYWQVADEKWFVSNPKKVTSRWQALSMGLFTVAALLLVPLVFAAAMLSLSGIQALIASAAGIGLVIAGAIVWVMARKMPARTARGTAMLHQGMGFKKYLETAEAHQIRFEEAQNVFSRYLPYAIVFGVADRWARVFDDVVKAAQADGFEVAMPTWYVMNQSMYGWNLVAFNAGLNNFSHAAEGALTYTPPAASGGGSSGASGHSGFGGGGMVGGGGFGGGGGGSW